jgi:transmembrane sensor
MTMDVDSDRETGERLRREAWEWVLKLTSGEATSGDQNQLACWRGQSPRHEAAFVEVRAAWRELGPVLEGAQPAARSADAAAATGRVGRRAILAGALGMATAAGVVVAVRPPLGLWPSYREIAADYHTGTGEQRRVALAEQAVIELNTRTSLNVRSADHVELIAGEVAVTARSRLIEVTAANGRISAMDGRLNVRIDDLTACVACFAGDVQVAIAGTVIAVPPGRQLSYIRNDFSGLSPVDPDVVSGWQHGLLIFRDVPLARVVEDINRYRPGRIILMSARLGERKVSASLKLSRLDAIAVQFREIFGVHVTTLPGGVVLVS